MNDLQSGGSILPIGRAVLLLALIVGSYGGPTGQSSTAHAASAHQGGIPLAFVPNQGQAPFEDAFVAHIPDGVIRFQPGAIELQLAIRSSSLTGSSTATEKRQSELGGLRMQFVSPSDRHEILAEEEGRAKINYIRGRDARDHAFDVPTFARLRYDGLYPGIDLLYSHRPGTLKGEFHVRPGANPSSIRWTYPGAERITLKSDGSLEIRHHMTDGTVLNFVEEKPIAWQVRGTRRQPIEIAFQVDDLGGQVGFAIADHDPDRALVIDPSIEYAALLGDRYDETVDALEVDSSGHAYIVGQTSSGRFPLKPSPTGRPQERRPVDDPEGFVSKLMPGGQELVFSTFIGGSLRDRVRDVAVDESGRVYIAGNTESRDFPILQSTDSSGRQPVQGSLAGFQDGFIARLTSDGILDVNDLDSFSTYIGGVVDDQINAIALDRQGRVAWTGTTASSGFLITDNSWQNRLRGPRDVVIGLLDESMPQLRLEFSTYLGGDAADFANDLTADPNGDILIVGCTESADFPVAGANNIGSNALPPDVFLSRFDSGGGLLSSIRLGGRNTDIGNGLTLDESGDVIVVGTTFSPDFPTADPFQAEANPGPLQREPVETEAGCRASLENSGRLGSDMFVSTIRPDLNRLAFSSFFGGEESDFAHRVTRGPANRIYLVGSSVSRSIRMVNPVADPFGRPRGTRSALIAGIDRWPDGYELSFSSYLSSEALDDGIGIAAWDVDRLLVAGNTRSIDFLGGASVIADESYALGLGGDNVFVVELKVEPPPSTTPTPTMTPTFTVTPSSTPTSTRTPSGTPTRTATTRPSITPSITPTVLDKSVYLPIILRDRYCPPLDIYTDVILVVDASTSMNDQIRDSKGVLRRKIDIATDAARLFIGRYLNLNQPGRLAKDQIGIVLFSSIATQYQVLTRDEPRLYRRLQVAQDYLSEGSQIHLGIATGIEMLRDERFAQSGNRMAMLLITDGIVAGLAPNGRPATPEDVRREAQRARDLGIDVYVIGYGENIARDLLQVVANESKDRYDYYYESPYDEQLVDVVGRMTRKIPCPEEIYLDWP